MAHRNAYPRTSTTILYLIQIFLRSQRQTMRGSNFFESDVSCCNSSQLILSLIFKNFSWFINFINSLKNIVKKTSTTLCTLYKLHLSKQLFLYDISHFPKWFVATQIAEIQSIICTTQVQWRFFPYHSFFSIGNIHVFMILEF